jgi:hypothetical protein
MKALVFSDSKILEICFGKSIASIYPNLNQMYRKNATDLYLRYIESMVSGNQEGWGSIYVYRRIK